MSLKTVLHAIVLAAATHAGTAAAALGGDAASVESDRAAMGGAVVQTTPGEGYTVHEIQTPSGTAVKEYVSAAGTVFAVSWSGPALPDLRQLLGAQFETYVEGARAQNAGPGRIDVRRAGLVVQSAGRMRAFFGRAYLPALVPQGMALDQIR